MAQTQIAKRAGQAQSENPGQSVQRVPEPDVIHVPDVDIRESGSEITLLADMPGADQQSVDVTVENNVLTIEGRAHADAPAGYELVGREYGVGRFRRDFTLSDQVDTGGIKARVRNGVLEVTLPKREEEQSKRKTITIESA